MELVALVTLAALAQYLVFGMQVGAARGKYGIKAPKTTGDENFERLFRVQMNTLEQLAVFLPALWLFATFTSARWALLPGVVFIIGRQLYAWEYAKDPASRTPGMALTFLATGVLMIGALAGVVMKMI